MRLSCLTRWFAGSVEAMTQGVIRIGSRVRAQDGAGEAEFCLVDPEDADAMAGQVSVASPLGRALLGRQAGDEVRFRAPGGELAVTVLEVCG
jgi:transcription elongation GreA/GreB family factor